jgi:hypothetical protein
VKPYETFSPNLPVESLISENSIIILSGGGMRKIVIAATLLIIATMIALPIISEAFRYHCERGFKPIVTYSDEEVERIPQIAKGETAKGLHTCWNNLIKRCKLTKISNRIEISEEYKANIRNILNSDEDVKKLLENGYNITAITPIIKAVVQGNGEVVLKATEATVTLRKDNEGIAYVEVNLELSKVTRIVILSRTVIEK